MSMPEAVKAATSRRAPQIEQHAEQVKIELAESWLPRIYRERILKLRTRAYHFPPLKKNARVDIQHTLLGVELKAGKSRMLCPDLATARYLAVFARAGCQSVAVPYDITRISHFADELDSSWHRMLLVGDHSALDKTETFKSRLRSLLIAAVREEIDNAGAGTAVPDFKQSTKQSR
jgi:hypothetical protein